MSTTAVPPASTNERHSTETGLDVVTGAFSYSGRAISAELLRRAGDRFGP